MAIIERILVLYFIHLTEMISIILTELIVETNVTQLDMVNN